MASHRMAEARPGASSRSLDAAGQGTVIYDGVPNREKSPCLPERFRPNQNTPAGCHSEARTRVVAHGKGIEQLKKIDKGRRKQLFPKVLHAQMGHNRDEIELFADQFLSQSSD